MAAPSGTEWGAIKGSGNKQGRIGIYKSITKSQNEISVTIEVWYWTRYAVDDSSNTFKYGWGTSAGITIGSKTIMTKNGESWGTFNQILIGRYSTKFSRGTSAQTKYASASFTGIEYGGGSGSVTVQIPVPAKDNYTVSFDANGGTGAPSSLNKPIGVSISLPNAIPIRNGYTFQGWGTSRTATVVAYTAGGTYSANASATLYAIWKANTYTIRFDANGGSGAPIQQMKTHGVNLTLPSTIPVRQNYRFDGWGVSKESTTVVYRPGDQFTDNADMTLYAIWTFAFNKPRIENYIVQRCDAGGNYQADGTYCRVKFDWECDTSVVSIKIEYKITTSSYWTEIPVDASGLSGTVNQIVGGSLNPLNQYDIRVTVEDIHSSSSYSKPLSSKKRLMEWREDRDGITFGGTADEAGLVSYWDLKLKTGRVETPNGLEIDGLIPYENEVVDIGKMSNPFANGYFNNLYTGGEKLLYDVGDVVEIETYINGWWTNNGNRLYFSLPIGKSISNKVTGITPNSCSVIARQNGGYCFKNDWQNIALPPQNKWTIRIQRPINTINFIIEFGTAYARENNSPVAIHLKIKFTFE